MRNRKPIRTLLASMIAVLVTAIVGMGHQTAYALGCPCIFPGGPYKLWVMLDPATVAVFDCTTGQIIATIPVGGGCNSIAAKPDCTTVFVGTVGIPGQKPPGFCDIDCETFQVTERPLPAPPIPNGIICKGNLVWVAMENGQVAVFNCDTGDMQFVTVGGGCNSIIAKCNGSVVFVGTAGIPGVKGPGFCDIDCDTLQVIERPLPVPPVPNGFWLSPNDQKLWIMLQDFSVCVIDCFTGNTIAKIPVGGACNSIVGKCDGTTVFVGNVGGGVPQQWFPPGGTDFFGNTTAQVVIDVPGLGPIASNDLQGATTVVRQDPIRDYIMPTPATIPIEMVQLDLVGSSPVGPVNVRLNPKPTLPSLGQVQALDPLVEFPAESFFDVFVEIEIQTPMGPVIYRNQKPIPLQTEQPVTEIPPWGNWFIFEGPVPIPVFQDNNPNLPPDAFVQFVRHCLPPPPPPKPPGVCDIPCDTFIPTDCPLPAPPIPCGIAIKPGDQQVWVAMQNGQVAVYDCFWNEIRPPIPVGGGCTSIKWKPDMSTVFVGTEGVPGIKPPGICDIDPTTFEVLENPTPGIPLPKGLLVCTLPAPPVCPGDCNGDGVVNILDVNIVLGNFGTAGPFGDCNLDGMVNIIDLNLVIGNFGNLCP